GTKGMHRVALDAEALAPIIERESLRRPKLGEARARLLPRLLLEQPEGARRAARPERLPPPRNERFERARLGERLELTARERRPARHVVDVAEGRFGPRRLDAPGALLSETLHEPEPEAEGAVCALRRARDGRAFARGLERRVPGASRDVHVAHLDAMAARIAHD